jgi:predicted amidohydrolase YtcJ
MNQRHACVVLAAFAFVAAGIAGCRRSEPVVPADLVITGGKVYRADGSGGFAEAVAVRGNKILAVGSNEAVGRLITPATRVVDARGGAVLPGFNDSHLHVVSGGLGLEQAELAGAKSVGDLQRAIREFAAAHADRPWVLGRGWTYMALPGGLPTRSQLDEAVPDRPAFMRAYDGHTAWVNSKALTLAGITAATPDPPGGVIVKDAATGQPTGALKEAAQDLVQKVMPSWTKDDRLRAIKAAVATAHRFGVTSVQNAGGSADEMELYDALRKSGDLDLRVYVALGVEPGFTEADADRLGAIRDKYGDDPVLKTGAVKLYIDGVIESYTAVMLAPYANKATNAEPIWKPGEFNHVISLLDSRGWQVWVHAIGDGGVRMTLDAYEKAAAENAMPRRGRRHRIEHVETVDAADIPRFGRLGVIASQQPFHGTPDSLGVWIPNIGQERASRGWAYGSIRKTGGRITFGSDWGVVSMDPRIGIHTAVNRTSLDGTPAGGWLPEQKLPLAAVIDAYTMGPAVASFEEQRKGSLAPGMLADIVILSTDIFATPPERFLDAMVRLTVFDGRVVFDKDNR